MAREILCTVLNLYLLVLFARIVLSWFPPPSSGAFATIHSGVFRATEPVLAPLRRLIPPVRIGGVGLDLSIMVLLFGYQLVIRPILCS